MQASKFHSAAVPIIRQYGYAYWGCGNLAGSIHNGDPVPDAAVLLPYQFREQAENASLSQSPITRLSTGWGRGAWGNSGAPFYCVSTSSKGLSASAKVIKVDLISIMSFPASGPFRTE